MVRLCSDSGAGGFGPNGAPQGADKGSCPSYIVTKADSQQLSFLRYSTIAPAAAGTECAGGTWQRAAAATAAAAARYALAEHSAA